ncbi:MAG TPA: phosphatase PAP2 family protein [Parafilimonas sp.]|jgi:undecaprenyl-diphosphatase
MMNEAQQTSFKKILSLFSLEVLLVSVLFVLSLFVFAFIAKGVITGNEKTFDDKVFAFFSSYATPGFIQAMKVFTFLGSALFLITAYLILIAYFILKKFYRYAIDIAVIALSSTVLLFILKSIFQRQRPSLPIIRTITTYSFPSGHMLSSFVFCSILSFIVIKSRWKLFYKCLATTLLFLFAIMVGISRIVLKAHYATDVIASLFLGIAWVIASFYMLKKVNEKYLSNTAH